MPLSAFTQACLTATDENGLFRALQSYAANYNVDILTYHLLVENLRHLSVENGHVFHVGPPRWSEIYAQKNYRLVDPILAACVQSRGPFHWFEVGQIIPLTSEQRGYLHDLKVCNVKDGIAVPIHGGLGMAAVIAIGSTTHALPLNTEQRLELMSAGYQLHNRWMEIRGDSAQGPPLSKRETEVLTLVAKGKTNSAIADILGVSEHTIDTLVRRSFVKLGVTDRISAALKAVGMGKVQI